MLKRSNIDESAISLSNLEAAVAHDPGMFLQLIQQFEESLRVQTVDLGQELNRGDLASIVITSHRLAGSVAMFGAANLAVICRQIESAARSADLPAARNLHESFTVEAQRVLKALAEDAARHEHPKVN